MKQFKQAGSAHMVIIIILVLALLGTLGFVFYQNFIAKQSNDTPKVEEKPDNKSALQTSRMAFQNNIYAFDHSGSWSAETVSSAGVTTMTLLNIEKSVRVKVDVASGGIGGSCDTNSPRKVRYYKVYDTAVTALSGTAAYVVETMTDAEGSGYDYKIGLTQEGGETHATVGDSFCTVNYVGVASRLQIDTPTDTIITPTIIATIDFPKLAAGTDTRVTEMQQVKDMIATDDFKAAVKILESGRKE